MTIEHHKFTHEFPELKDAIHELKVNDPGFAAQMKEYDEIDDEIHRIEQGIETPSDDYTEKLKLERVNMKDKLYAMVKAHAEGKG